MAEDPFTLFEALLNGLPDLLARAKALPTTNSDDPFPMKAAVTGFSLFHPIRAWSRANYLFIQEHLDGVPPLDSFSPSDECRVSITVFACLALGALLGKFNAGELDDDQAAAAEWRLMAFTSLHGSRICECYHLAAKTTNQT